MPPKPRLLAQPSEVRDLSEYRTVAADGSIEVVKKQLVIYDSPVPCNTEANRENAVRRNTKKQNGGDEFGLFHNRREPQVDKALVKRTLEAQLEQKHREELQRREHEAHVNRELARIAAEKAKRDEEAERRRRQTLRDDAKRALEQSVSRNVPGSQPEKYQASLITKDDSEALRRTRERTKFFKNQNAQQVEERSKRSAEERERALKEAKDAAERALRERTEWLEKERQKKLAIQGELNDKLKRQAVEQQKNKDAAVNFDRHLTSVTEEIEKARLTEREKRDLERKKQLKQIEAENARRYVEAQERRNCAEQARIVYRTEKTVVMRCPKSGKLLPPSHFNAPRPVTA